jgi:glutathione S-transferase
MILYGSSLSPYVRKVLAFAGEKGIELELQPTGFPNHSPEYLQASPFRKNAGAARWRLHARRFDRDHPLP